MRRLHELATILRSKNAGPFVLTIDILFAENEDYEAVRDRKVVSPESIAAIYRVEVKDVKVQHLDVAQGIKVSLPRLVPSGDPDDTDVYGAQQHAPLLDLPIHLEVPVSTHMARSRVPQL